MRFSVGHHWFGKFRVNSTVILFINIDNRKEQKFAFALEVRGSVKCSHD